MTLSDFLTSCDAEHAIMVSQDGRRLVVGDVRPRSVSIPPVVAVTTRDPLEAVRTLIEADGIAHEVTVGFERYPDSQATHSRGSTRWILRTSGTTGRPKEVVHTLSTLVGGRRQHDPVAPYERWALVYPWDRFAGLQVILRAITRGGSVLGVDRSASLASQISFLREYGCTHMSATPTLWRLMLSNPDFGSVPLVQITLGGEIADQRILDALAETFPTARITHVYASTEAGSAFAVNDGLAGFPMSMLSKPREVRGIDVRDGELFIHNPNVANLQSLGDDESPPAWIATGDLVEKVGPRFRFAGRRDSMINVGGSKFRAEQLEQYVMTLPGVAQAVVRSRSSPIIGTLVIVELVANGSENPVQVKKRVIESCARDLPRYMMPGRVYIAEDFSIADSGKVKRR